jgi:hypothetical protein
MMETDHSYLGCELMSHCVVDQDNNRKIPQTVKNLFPHQAVDSKLFNCFIDLVYSHRSVDGLSPGGATR